MQGVRVLNALLSGPLTRAEMAARLGVGRTTVDAMVRGLETRDKPLLRVCGWLRPPGTAQGRDVAIYALSDGRPDAPPLARATRAEYDRRSKARDPQRWKEWHRKAQDVLKERDPEYFARAMREHRARRKAALPEQRARKAFDFLLAVHLL